MGKDFYKILGVNRNANQDEIKNAFRKLAHQYHPDKKTGDEAKFKEINEAYQILGDAEKRKKYDQFGSTAFEGGAGFGGSHGFGGFDFANAGFEDLGDLFGDLFGAGVGGRRRARSKRGADIQVDLDLTLREAVFGCRKEITLTRSRSCQRCGGLGAEPGRGMRQCEDCGGQGAKMSHQRTILGTIQTRMTCGSCHGTGEVPREFCSECRGLGLVKGRRPLTIEIPVGVDEGNVIRMTGEGEGAERGGRAGDLLIQIHVESDNRFERKGETIYSDLQIGFSQAALGDTVPHETIDGPIELTIPAGTQSGGELCLRGKGVPSRHGRGDQIIRVQVVTPKKLTKEQRRLLDEANLRI